MARKLIWNLSVVAFGGAVILMCASMTAASGSIDQNAAGVQTPPRPTFKAGIDVVSITAVVRDRKGRIVRNMSREDFVLFDAGQRRPIVEVNAAEAGPVQVAILLDISGSMRVASKLKGAQQAVGHVLSWLQPAQDEAALFMFDRELLEVQTFTNDFDLVRGALESVEAMGATSLYDAIAETARRVERRSTKRAAVIVVTDGIDNSSRLTAPEVSGIASSIDVPVYLITTVSPLDHPGTTQSIVPDEGTPQMGNLSNLARWTGGDLFLVSSQAHASMAARELLSELRHQYLIAFESAAEPGWHPLEVRTRDESLSVRARSGYIAGQPTTIG